MKCGRERWLGACGGGLVREPRTGKNATSTAESSGKVAAISSESPPPGYSWKLHVCYNGIVVEELE